MNRALVLALAILALAVYAQAVPVSGVYTFTAIASTDAGNRACCANNTAFTTPANVTGDTATAITIDYKFPARLCTSPSILQPFPYPVRYVVQADGSALLYTLSCSVDADCPAPFVGGGIATCTNGLCLVGQYDAGWIVYRANADATVIAYSSVTADFNIIQPSSAPTCSISAASNTRTSAIEVLTKVVPHVSGAASTGIASAVATVAAFAAIAVLL